MRRYLFVLVAITLILAGMLLAAFPAFADPSTDAEMRVRVALAMANGAKPVKANTPKANLVIPTPPDTSRQAAINQWLSQPLNFGNCPCAGTGGCHCNPHSLCAGGQCANHNPLLQGSAPTQAPQVQYTLPQHQSGGCPGGNCPNSGGGSSQGWQPFGGRFRRN